jgi:uncharacterized YccA/Bax inhibitor family protein
MAAPAQERAYERLSTTYPRIAAAEPFTAAGVYDKLAGLFFVVALSAAVGAFVLRWPAVLAVLAVAFVSSIAGIFKPSLARWCAPVYAVAEGAVLGAVSREYSNLGGGIVPLAIVFTAAVFVGCLAAYRTGLVRVTPRFLTMTMIATFGLMAVMIASLLGLPIPGVQDLGTKGLIFGVIGLGVGVLNLFVDFAVVQDMEERGADATGEWYGALILLTSLVLVYLSILRILASSRR